jgi:hypothetical protein
VAVLAQGRAVIVERSAEAEYSYTDVSGEHDGSKAGEKDDKRLSHFCLLGTFDRRFRLSWRKFSS